MKNKNKKIHFQFNYIVNKNIILILYFHTYFRKYFIKFAIIIPSQAAKNIFTNFIYKITKNIHYSHHSIDERLSYYNSFISLRVKLFVDAS